MLSQATAQHLASALKHNTTLTRLSLPSTHPPSPLAPSLSLSLSHTHTHTSTHLSYDISLSLSLYHTHLSLESDGYIAFWGHALFNSFPTCSTTWACCARRLSIVMLDAFILSPLLLWLWGSTAIRHILAPHARTTDTLRHLP